MFTSEFWPLIILLIALAAYFLMELWWMYGFQNFMKKIGYPPTQSLITPRKYYLQMRHAHDYAGMWFLRKRQTSVVVVCIAIFIFSSIHAYYIGLNDEAASEFSRSGALLVIAGFASLIFGFREKRKYKQAWDTLESSVDDEEQPKVFNSYHALLDARFKKIEGNQLKNAIDEFAENNIEKSEHLAFNITVIISILGTFIWAYGDQVWLLVSKYGAIFFF